MTRAGPDNATFRAELILFTAHDTTVPPIFTKSGGNRTHFPQNSMIPRRNSQLIFHDRIFSRLQNFRNFSDLHSIHIQHAHPKSHPYLFKQLLKLIKKKPSRDYERGLCGGKNLRIFITFVFIFGLMGLKRT